MSQICQFWKNLFTKRKVIVVLYNFDENDGKSWFLKVYYIVFFRLLKLIKHRVALVTQSNYFQEYFRDRFHAVPVVRIPNLFDVNKYQTDNPQKDPKKILLGQYSYKNDPAIFEIAKKLIQSGYYCFFLTLDDRNVRKSEFYEVKKLPFEEYLYEMSISYCSIALSSVKEGWNRMAHESILVGTPIIGLDSGGLGDLLKESGSYIVHSAGEVYELIINDKVRFDITPGFIDSYNESKWSWYLKPLIQFIQS